MADGEQRTVADVVREVIVALSPGELPRLDSVFESYRHDPWTVEDDVRLPVDDAVPWAVFVMGFVGQSVVGTLRTPVPRHRGRKWRWRRRAEGGDPAGMVLPAAGEAQLQHVRADAMEAATFRGCSPEDREAFAAAVVTALTIGRLPLPRRSSPA